MSPCFQVVPENDVVVLLSSDEFGLLHPIKASARINVAVIVANLKKF